MSVAASPSMPLKELFAAATSPEPLSPAAVVNQPTPKAPLGDATPRASNLPPPSVFSKHTQSPFAPADTTTTTTTPITSSLSSSPAQAPSSASSNPPTPTFHGTPPVTPFLTQRRGR